MFTLLSNMLFASRSLTQPVPPPANRNLGVVTQIVFFALHGGTEWDFVQDRPGTDTKILKHYAASLPRWVRLWALQYREESANDRIEVSYNVSRFIAAGACSWGRAALKRIFPRLVNRTNMPSEHPGLALTSEVNLRRYFWFHSSLILWNVTFGHAYPHVNFWWREFRC